MSTKEAMDHLIQELRRPEYRYGWQANIAMAFKDHWAMNPYDPNGPPTAQHIHEIANGAAKAFLEQISPMRETTDLPGSLAVALTHQPYTGHEAGSDGVDV